MGPARTDSVAPVTIAFRPCPVCGAVECEPLHRQSFVVPDDHPLTNGYDVVACQACGMVYADSTVNQAGYDSFYSRFSKYPDERDNYTGGGRLLAESGPPWDRARLQETATILARFLADTKTPILDVGCANGTLLVELRKLGYSRLTGLDPSPEAAANAGANESVHGLVGSLHSPPPGLEGYGAVVVAHVLEHVWDMAGAMSSLRSALAPGGLVYAEVPDAARYAEFLFAPFHDFSTEHINHFSMDALMALFDAWGFEPVDSGARLVELGPAIPFPVIHGVWRLPVGPAGKPTPAANGIDLRDRIRSYIAGSEELLLAFDDHLRAELEDDVEVIIWGVGELTMKLLQLPAMQGRRVILVDSGRSKQGLKVNGEAVLAPTEIAHKDCPIIVGSVHHRDSIVEGVRAQHGLANLLVTLDAAGARRAQRAMSSLATGSGSDPA